MAKLNKMYYYTSTGEKKLNCYMVPIPKDLVEKTKLENVDIQWKVEKDKLILERKTIDKIK